MKSLLSPFADLKKAQKQLLFYKTGKGEYGEGDKFLGVSVPNLRKVAKENSDIGLKELQKLMRSSYNDERALALFILGEQFKKSDAAAREKIVQFYLKHLLYVNNWNLVDCSAPYLLGAYLLDKERTILYQLAKSYNLWERRVAIVSTWWFIRHGDYKDALKISELLLRDEQDLIHKASGWMLREVGKKDEKLLLKFLDKHSAQMPRTMLRYAIERLPEKKRRMYMDKKFTTSSK